MKILVTGGDGFIGSYLVNELIKKNEVAVISDKTGTDICDKDAVLEKVNGYDVVYHLAGNIRTPTTDSKELHQNINTTGTKNVLDACLQNGIPKLVFVSSSEVYGDKSNVDETEIPSPVNDYGKSKLAAEEYCKENAGKTKIIVIRPAYIYGHGQYKERLFPKLIQEALEKGKTNLVPQGGNDFVYIKDVVKGLILLSKCDEDFEVFNLSSGKFTPAKEIFQAVKEEIGLDYEDNDDIEHGFYLNIDKARKQGYNPEFDVKDGIKDFIKVKNGMENTVI